MFTRFAFVLFPLFLSLTLPCAGQNLKAGIAIIPTQSEYIDNQAKGGFVDLVRAIDSAYVAGDIELTLYPFARSIDYVARSKVDFHLPLIRPVVNLDDSVAFSYVDEPIAAVSFVLYSHKNAPLKASDNLQEMLIDTQRGHKPLFEFSVSEVNTVSMGIQKLLKKRSEGFIFEQEAVDRYLKAHNIRDIHRALFRVYDSMIIVPKSDKGTETARLLKSVILRLKQSNQLQPIVDKIHGPYVNWQPYD